MMVLLPLWLVNGHIAYAAGPCAIYKVFSTGGSFTAADANSIQTVLGQSNMLFSCLDDYSATVAQMQTTVDPYPGGVESLATTGQGEIERLRYLLQQIHGRTYWYQDPDPLNPPGDIQVGVANTRGGAVIFYHASSAFSTTFRAGLATATGAYVWPTAPPSATKALFSDSVGNLSWGTTFNDMVQVGVASSTTGLLKLGNASSALLTTLQAGNNTQAVTYTWPTADGTSGQNLSTNGSGVLSWTGNETGTYGSNLAGVTRVAGTVYQNTSGKKRRVALGYGGAGMGKMEANLSVGSANPPTINLGTVKVDVNATATSHSGAQWGEVSNNWYYKVTVTTGTVDTWYEIDE